MDYIYNAVFEADPDGGFAVNFPDVPEAITGGKDEAEAEANAADGLAAALSGYIIDEQPLPEAKFKGGVPVFVGALNAAKFAVIAAFRTAGITKTELARRLGKDEKEVRRLLDPDQLTKMQSLEQALAALGKQVVITVRDVRPAVSRAV